MFTIEGKPSLETQVLLRNSQKRLVYLAWKNSGKLTVVEGWGENALSTALMLQVGGGAATRLAFCRGSCWREVWPSRPSLLSNGSKHGVRCGMGGVAGIWQRGQCSSDLAPGRVSAGSATVEKRRLGRERHLKAPEGQCHKITDFSCVLYPFCGLLPVSFYVS